MPSLRLKPYWQLHQPESRIMVLGALCKDHEGYRHFSITSTEARRASGRCPDCAATANVSCPRLRGL